MGMMSVKRVLNDEYRQKKINESKTKVSETVDSFRGALNSVLDDAVNPVYEKIEDTYKHAMTIGDFAKAEIITQKILAELIEMMDKNLKRLVG